MSVEELNQKFAIPGRLEFVAAEAGLTKAVITERGGTLEIFLNGGQVASWSDSNGTPILFMSRAARYQEGKALRGGVPVIFPQFGDGKLPQHGFARNSMWRVSGSERKSEETSLLLELSSSEATRAIWPHDFRVEYRVTLGQTLKISAGIFNTGSSPFDFQFALHSYFTVSDIAAVRIEGLQGLDFLDKTADFARKREERPAVTFVTETDSIYIDSPAQVEIIDLTLKRRIAIDKSGFPDTVVWNPWEKKGASMADMEESGYQRFVCVESAVAAAQMQLLGGDLRYFDQEISVTVL